MRIFILALLVAAHAFAVSPYIDRSALVPGCPQFNDDPNDCYDLKVGDVVLTQSLWKVTVTQTFNHAVEVQYMAWPSKKSLVAPETLLRPNSEEPIGHGHRWSDQ